MKKVLVILVIGLVLGWMNISTAHASIVIDGIATGGEWVAPFQIYATDPAESGIADHLDVKLLLAQWSTPGGDIYIRTDTVSKPEFIKDSGYLNDAYITWQFDFDGNGSVDLSAQLIKEVDFGHANGDIYYYVGGTQYDNGGATTYWGMNDIYEVLIPAEKVPVFNPNKFQMRLATESASTSGDDNLPDTGWAKTPEPGSMALVGMGLFGFVGSLLRRKFNA